MYTGIPMIALPRIIPLLALALLASGCEQTMTATGAGNVEEMPLLVRFAQNPEGKWCPQEVIQMVESCGPLPTTVLPGKDLVCRGKDKTINWVAVNGDLPPYFRDRALPEFEIRFKVPDDDPTKGKFGGKCKDSKSGVLECKIAKNAKADYEYKYGVHTSDCGLDPRIYVH